MRIAIALAAYEPNLDYFFEQLESIQNQTHSDFECFIQFDSELEHIYSNKKFINLINDGRFHWNKNPSRLGFKKNFEAALSQILRKSEAHAIAFSDQDDIWDLEKLEQLLKIFETLPPLSIVHSDMRVIDKNEKLITTSAWKFEKRGVNNVDPLDLVVRNVVTGAGLLMDRALAEKFPTILKEYDFHDHYYASLASVYGQVVPLKRSLYTYRIHGDNVVGVKSYSGLTANPNKRTLKQIAERTSEVWSETKGRASAIVKAATNQDASTIKRVEHIVLSDVDYGVSLLTYGLMKKIGRDGDDPLFRSVLVNSLGKIRSFFKRSSQNQADHKNPKNS
ncbi:MAG: glycosyltransferase [Xanthomonadaceae bacterium]|nr:glycosyltransferase [Xanthomonadaceae bacterium]